MLILIFSKNQLHLIFRKNSWLLEFVKVFQLAFGIFFRVSVGFEDCSGFQSACAIVQVSQLAFGIIRVFSWLFVTFKVIQLASRICSGFSVGFQNCSGFQLAFWILRDISGHFRANL